MECLNDSISETPTPALPIRKEIPFGTDGVWQTVFEQFKDASLIQELMKLLRLEENNFDQAEKNEFFGNIEKQFQFWKSKQLPHKTSISLPPLEQEITTVRRNHKRQKVSYSGGILLCGR